MADDGRPSRGWWALGVIAALLAGGAYVAQIVAGVDTDPATITWLAIVGGVATAAVIIIAAAQTATQSRARRTAQSAAATAAAAAADADAAAADASAVATRAVAEFEVALNDIFLPFSDILSKCVNASTANRSGLQAEAKRAVVNYAAKFIGADRVRACFFELSGDVGSRRLECDGVYDGRSGGPRTIFRETNPNHKHVFEQIDRGEVEFWPDLAVERPKGSTSRVYRAFISAPVATTVKAYGLLTVDALESDDLAPRHEPFVRLFAQLLAVAIKGNKQERIGRA